RRHQSQSSSRISKQKGRVGARPKENFMPTPYNRANSAAQDIMDRVSDHVRGWLYGRDLRAADLHGAIRNLIVEVIYETEQDTIALHTIQNDDEQTVERIGMTPPPVIGVTRAIRSIWEGASYCVIGNGKGLKMKGTTYAKIVATYVDQLVLAYDGDTFWDARGLRYAAKRSNAFSKPQYVRTRTPPTDASTVDYFACSS